jgi:hypothetical protein
MQTDWAYEELYRARLWDKRCLCTLLLGAQQLLQQAQVSFSRALGSRRKAVSRILHHEQTSAEDLLHGHIRATAVRAQTHPFVLVASDTTSMDFTSHKAVQGVGPISSLKHQKGFLLHSALAISPQGVPLGVLHQQAWVRDPTQAGCAKARRKRPFADKESHKWLDALHGVEAALPSGCKALLIQDREADLFAFFSVPRREGIDLLIRATQPRSIQVSDPSGPRILQEAAAQAPIVGERWVQVRERPNQPAREAHLIVRKVSVWVLAPHNDPKPAPPPVCLQVVRAAEENPPAGVREPLEWVLLSTLPVQEDAEALALVDYYAFRWLIERFHFVLKSGCGFENLQLDTFATLQKAISLYSIVAWRILYLTYLSRQLPTTPVEEILCPTEKQLLQLASGQAITTVQEASRALAKIGGFVSVPSAPVAGVKSLWIGFRKLQDMLAGFLLAQSSSSST